MNVPEIIKLDRPDVEELYALLQRAQTATEDPLYGDMEAAAVNVARAIELLKSAVTRHQEVHFT